MDNDSSNAGPPPVPPPQYPLPPFPAPTPTPKPATRQPSRKGRGWIILAIVIGAALICAAIGAFTLVVTPLAAILGGTAASAAGEMPLQEITLENNHSNHKIAVISVEGIIMGGDIAGGHSDMVRLVQEQLKKAARDHDVKAVLLRVDSPGGEVLASDEIYSAIQKFQKDHNKPVIASMGSLAASGGYYVSAPCRWIVANELTITGSIGVIMHTYNYRGLMNKVGLRPLVFKSGRFKDMLSGEKDLDKLTPAEQEDFKEEAAMIQRMITETFDRFRQVVGDGRQWANDLNKSNRGNATGRKLINTWTNYADGRVLSGKEAYEHGFVDELGDIQAALSRARSLANIDSADLVTYQPPFDLGNLFRIFGKSETKSLKVDLGFDIPKLKPGLYYITPSFLQ
jgi:protease-4